MDADLQAIGRYYKAFANNEAHGQSQLYEELALCVSEDLEVLKLLESLPQGKRQPNLLFASFRSLLGLPSGYEDFRDRLLAQRDMLIPLILERSTQTNEPARCATFLPLLAALPQPLAILEVGAAAGLCLLPDRYGYAYGDRILMPSGVPDPPVFRCDASEAVPLPEQLPEIAWRAGVDLNPLDLTNANEAAWLETLVWPGNEKRLIKLRKAIAIARREAPRVTAGDLLTDLEKLLVDVPSHCTKVIFHSAVLAYIPNEEDRENFTARAMAVADHWIANEAPQVLPRIAQRAPKAPRGAFLLSLDGEPVAWTNPHGRSVDWIN